MSFLKRTSGAYVWGQLGRLAEAALFFGFSLLLARSLGPRQYGVYALGLSAAGVCGFLTLLGLGPETFGKFVPELAAAGNLGNVRLLLKRLLVTRFLTVVAAVAAVYLVSRSDYVQSRLRFFEGSLAWILLVFAGRAFYDLLGGFHGALLDLRQVALAKTLAGVTAPLVFLLFAGGRGPSPEVAFLATAAGYLVGAFLLFRGWIRPAREPLAAARTIPFRRILQFGLFTWAVNFFIFVLSDNTDVLLVRWLLGDPASVGYYSVGARLVFRLVTLVMGWVPLFAVASISQANVEGGHDKIAALVQAQWKLTVITVVAPLALLWCFARPIIVLLFSPAYLPSVEVVRILCLLMICSAVCGLYLHSGILFVLNHERLASAIVGSTAVFNVALEIFLVREMGIKGAAWATGIAYIILSITTAAVSAVFVPLRIPWQFISKILFSVFVAALGTHWLAIGSLWELGIVGMVWTVIVGAALTLLKPLGANDSLHLTTISPRMGLLASKLFARGAATAEGRQAAW
jgi:O-antigen/teichoic acid export membrane protein